MSRRERGGAGEEEVGAVEEENGYGLFGGGFGGKEGEELGFEGLEGGEGGEGVDFGMGRWRERWSWGGGGEGEVREGVYVGEAWVRNREKRRKVEALLVISCVGRTYSASGGVDGEMTGGVG